MPLVVISGYPASGKTTRARALADSLETLIANSVNPAHRKLSVSVVNDESLGIKRSAYAEARSEKEARAAFSSAIKRELGRERIVIADAMNYIKGFRYQMYCEAKALQTPSCCLHIATAPIFCKQLNEEIEAMNIGSSYKQEILDNLIFRYEEPSAFARWDSPLFTLPAEDDAPPSEAIFRALVGGSPLRVSSEAAKSGGAELEPDLKRVRPNLATVAPVQTEMGGLQKVDRICADVIGHVRDWQAQRGIDNAADVTIDETRDNQIVVKLPAGGLTITTMQRLRREFVKLMRANPTLAAKGEGTIKEEFTFFINRHTWEDD